MADAPKSFADYMKQAQQGTASPVSAPAPTSLPELNLFGSGAGGTAQAQAQKNGHPQDPLSWLVDIVTRPLSGVTNVVQSAVNRSADSQAAAQKGDFGGVLASSLGSVNPLGDFLSGVVSADPSQHRTFSDVIEQSTDRFGKNADPNYVDTANNVNPVVKGVAGLAGDIALDPLTWIPGAAFLKAGGVVAKGAKGALEGASAAKNAILGTVKAGEDAGKAAEAAAKIDTKIKPPTGASAELAAASRAAEDKAIYDAHYAAADALPLDDAMSRAMSYIADARRGDIGVASASPKGQEIARALEMFKPMELTNVKRTKGITAAQAKPKSFGVQTAGTYTTSSWLSDAAESIAKIEAPSAGIKKLSVIVDAALSGDPKALVAARKFYDEKYIPAFATAKQQGKLINALGQVIPEVKPTTTTTTTILDSLGAYRKAMADHADAVNQALGPKLSSTLSQYTSATSFDKVVSELRGILDQSIDVPAMRTLSAPAKQMLRQVGIDPAAIPLGVKPYQATANTVPVAKSLPEQLARMAGESSTEIIDLAEGGLKSAVFRDIVDPKAPESIYKYETKTGVLRTEDKYGDGMGRAAREANTYFQWNLTKGMYSKVSAMAKKLGLYGMAQADFKSRTVREAARLAERVLDQKGIPLTIGVGMDRLPISQSQIWDLLHSIDAKATYRTLWNYSTSVPPTNLLDAVYSALKGGSRETIETLLRQTKTRHIRSDGREIELPNNLVKGGFIGPSKINGQPSMKNFVAADDLVRELTDLIEKATPALSRVVEANANALAARKISETYTMTDANLKELEQLFASKNGFGDLLKAIESTPERLQKEASAAGAMQESTNLAGALTEALIPAADKVVARAAVATEKLLQQPAKSISLLERESVPVQQKAYEDVIAAEDFVTGGNVVDLGEKTSQMIGRGIVGKVLPVFSRRAGTEQIYPNWMRSENVYRTLLGHYNLVLSDIAKSGLSPEELSNLLRNARNGLPGEGASADVQAKLADLWGQMFGMGDKQGALIENAFLRNGTNLDHLNAMFVNNGLDDYIFDVEKAITDAKASGNSVMQEVAKQAQQWDIKDPLNTMQRMYDSFLTLQVQSTLAQDFMKKVKDLGAFSKTPKPGYSLVGNDSGKSIFAKYLPNDVYIQDDVLHQMHAVDNLSQQTMELKGPLGTFIREVFQPLQQAWKYGMTLPNPTHHVRNLVSDYSLTYYANGVKGAREANVAAFQALATHNAYTGWDAVRALQGMEKLPDAGHIVATGKLGELTADGLYTALGNRGNLLTFKHLEQLNEAGDEMVGKGPLAAIWDKAQHSTVAQKIGGVSEARDHFSRLQHAAQFIIQNIDNTKSYKSLEDLLDAASEATRKWHPDGTDMTRPEQYFRLLIPFYSWQRKAIPLIVESMLAHPGRVLSIPKAQYNFAVAMGINPDSLSDPFPSDQMFPGYLTEQISGATFEIDGKYYGINPGFAANDILNDWVGANPVRTLLGSTSPIIRAPFEMAAGGQVGTGARINDYSDYIDSQIPGVGQVSRITGTSVTGSLVSLLQGKGLDPQYQIAQGNKDPVAGPALSALNWLTGAGVNPMSQDNQINYAEIEKRNREGTPSAF